MSEKQTILQALMDVNTHLTSATNATDIDTMRAAVLAAKDCQAVATQAALDLPPADNGTRIAEESVAALPETPDTEQATVPAAGDDADEQGEPVA